MDPRLQKLANFLQESRLVMTWVDMLDIAFIGAFLSMTFVWLRGRAFRSLFFAAVPLIVVFLTAQALNMYLTSMLFQVGFIAVSIAFVVTFQEDFRRAFESLAAWRPWTSGSVGTPAKTVDLIVDCVTGFSQNKTGALIIFQGRQPIKGHVRSGITANATVSLPLLQSIFDHHSPGHDGAVTIIDGRIAELGVHLPLSRNPQATGRLGTRHAAALGLAEKCDALILVVSEETGTISLAMNGRLRPVRSATEIKKTIQAHLRGLGPMRLHRTIFAIPWFRLTASMALSFCLWMIFVRPTQGVQRMVDVPIVYKNLPEGWEATPPEPAMVKLTLFGPEGPVIALDPASLAASLDLARVKEGAQQVSLNAEGFSLPSRVRVRGMEPAQVRVSAFRSIEHRVPVRVIFNGKSQRFPSSARFKVEPAEVKLRLPRSVTAPAFIETEPVNPRDLKKDTKVRTRLRTPSNLSVLDLHPSAVEITAK